MSLDEVATAVVGAGNSPLESIQLTDDSEVAATHVGSDAHM